MSPLAEQQRENLPLRERLHPLSAIAKQGVEFVRKRVEKHGIFGEILVWMVVFSGIRLLWSSDFPFAWWIIMGILIIYEALKDKFIWPAQKYQDKIEAEKAIAAREAAAAKPQNGAV